MSLRLAINGLGRIGRSAVRVLQECQHNKIKLVAVNGTMPAESYVTLLKYDSIHGVFPKEITASDDSLTIAGNKIKFFSERNPTNLAWEREKIDLVLECTGKFKDKNSASQHLQAGAKKVIISAPGTDIDKTIIFGVNHHLLQAKHNIISVGSCTTNAVAPIAQVLSDSVGIERGCMTTVHAYTNDQNVLDNSHKDIRRARACNMSMIPTTTGAAKLIGSILPELKGKISGSAIRVPVPNVSLIDFVFVPSVKTSVKEINEIMYNASKSFMKNIIAVAEQKLVSIDFNHSSYSAIFDPFETKVTNEKLVRIVAWYDNEWGFANRMIDIAKLYATLAELVA